MGSSIMTKLTKRQQEILALIESHLATSGSPPTRAEIAKTMGFRSPNAAEDHLRALARKGVIELVPGTSRGIRLTHRQSGLPVINTHRIHPNQAAISDGPIEGHCQGFDRAFFHPAADYLLQFSHKAVPELLIQQGDYLAIHKTSEVSVNDIFLSRSHQEVLVRRYTTEQGHLSQVEGLVVGVVRAINHLIKLS